MANQAVANDVSIYESIDEKKTDSQREPQYSQLNIATINTEGLYATSSTAVHHAERGERRGEKKASHSKNKMAEKAIGKVRPQKEGTNSKVTVCIFITIAVVAIVLLICIAVLFAEVAKLQQLQLLNNNISEIRHTTLTNSIGSLNISFHEQLDMRLNTSIELIFEQVSATLDDHTVQINQLLETVNSSVIDSAMRLLQLQFVVAGLPLISCAALAPNTPSGYYWVRASNGSAVRVYCDMTLSCGNITGGWMRVAELDFNNTSIMCPSSLSPLKEMNTRTCRIASSGAGCASVLFSTSGVTYNQVCGKVLAYQIGVPDAFGVVGPARQYSTIDGNYVDGVSLTHGTGPRQHIWTFAAALDEHGGGIIDRGICRCSTQRHSGTPPPAFVGHDYFCDSGLARFTLGTNPGLVITSPLWDGAGCRPDSTCCTFNNPPWFHKQLPSPTSDDIEMRVCRDQGRSDEDIALSSVEIYIN